MTIPYNPLEHLRDPDMRCKVLVCSRNAKISIEITREHDSREKCRRAVISGWLNRWSLTAPLSLVWQTGDWVRGRHCRVLGKTGSANQGFFALSGTGFSRGQAEKPRSWFRVWACCENGLCRRTRLSIFIHRWCLAEA
jgi:hypothetical protein